MSLAVKSSMLPSGLNSRSQKSIRCGKWVSAVAITPSAVAVMASAAYPTRPNRCAEPSDASRSACPSWRPPSTR
ncbi:hypothetical protein OG967_41125 [Streptomyces phaeochromogenes]